ncbi:hypothetical protein [Clostridium pasteurianum]|uniref:Uncharacterized protein n=1 Tax=Clostridium pasteurianum BC1 TaxID=86416 RepID=R4K2H1_CLOPA|nr:hypothetical protein [Clostridium pasteurianum]AGK96778.1 hypothetical protein Clopa_1878 [Clostridium pasteurianum BC1]
MDTIRGEDAKEILEEAHSLPSEKSKVNGKKLIKKYKTLEESKKMWEQWLREIDQEELRNIVSKNKTVITKDDEWRDETEWDEMDKEDDNLKELENLYSRLDNIKRELLELEKELADERLEHVRAVDNRNVEYQIKTKDRMYDIDNEVIRLLEKEKAIIDKIMEAQKNK